MRGSENQCRGREKAINWRQISLYKHKSQERKGTSEHRGGLVILHQGERRGKRRPVT